MSWTPGSIVNLRKTSRSSDMTSIEEGLAGLKPWWDAPETREKASMCMVIASLAGQLGPVSNFVFKA